MKLLVSLNFAFTASEFTTTENRGWSSHGLSGAVSRIADVLHASVEGVERPQEPPTIEKKRLVSGHFCTVKLNYYSCFTKFSSSF